ncbi:MAG: hypothetical protein WD317_03860 [Balneolaceae bacterium]
MEIRLDQHSNHLEHLFEETDVYALNIPEIQDESKKGDKGKRRQPYKERVSPRNYARSLAKRFDTDFVINRVVVKHSYREHEKWLLDTQEEFGIRNVILVGGERSEDVYPGPSVSEGNRFVKHFLNRGRFRYTEEDTAPTHFNVGNICIPTRRRKDLDEPERMFRKQQAGADFFTTQIIAEAEHPISLLRDYSEILQDEDLSPPRIYWSFSPVSSKKDIDFLRWLGVYIPERTENLIFGSSDPVATSLDLAQTVWEKILDFNRQLPLSIPMGINISVMGLRNFENGVRLAKELKMAGVPD